MLAPNAKVGLVKVIVAVDELVVVVLAILFVSILPFNGLVELIGTKAELNGILSLPKRLVDVDEVAVIEAIGVIVLLDMLVLKLSNELDATAGVADLPKINVEAVVMLEDAADILFCNIDDTVLVTAGVTFARSIDPSVLAIKFVPFTSKTFVASAFVCIGNVEVGTL